MLLVYAPKIQANIPKRRGYESPTMTFQQHFSYNTFVKFIHRSVTKQRQRLHNTFMIASQPASQPSAIHNPPFQPIIIMGHNQIITIIIINYSSPTQLASVAHKWELDSLTHSSSVGIVIVIKCNLPLRFTFMCTCDMMWSQVKSLAMTTTPSHNNNNTGNELICLAPPQNVYSKCIPPRSVSVFGWMTVWNISSYMKHTFLW